MLNLFEKNFIYIVNKRNICLLDYMLNIYYNSMNDLKTKKKNE